MLGAAGDLYEVPRAGIAPMQTIWRFQQYSRLTREHVKRLRIGVTVQRNPDTWWNRTLQEARRFHRTIRRNKKLNGVTEDIQNLPAAVVFNHRVKFVWGGLPWRHINAPSRQNRLAGSQVGHGRCRVIPNVLDR